jgi:hypothetical protein
MQPLKCLTILLLINNHCTLMHLKQFCLVTIYLQFFFFYNLQHELISSFDINAKAIYHLFFTRQKPNKMHHCEISFQNLYYAHEAEVHI